MLTVLINFGPVIVESFGILLGVLLIGGVILSLFPQKKCRLPNSEESDNDQSLYPGGFSKPILALELPASGDDIRLLLASDECRAFQRRNLIGDSLVFIPLYWFLLAIQCVFCYLAKENSAVIYWIGWTALAFATLAAAFDYVENYFMWRAVKFANERTDSTAKYIRYPSLCKWSLIFITLDLLSVFFFKISGWGLIVGICYLLTSLIGAYGVAFSRPAIEKAVYPLGFAVLPLIYLCIFKASEIINQISS